MRTLILSTFLCATAFAQVGGPFLGYVPDGTRIRPMRGLPAAGAIDAAIPGRGFSHIAIPPQQYFAVVTAADTGEVLVAQEVITGGFTYTQIPAASLNPDMLAISPGGASAALWFPLSGHLQAIGGLPNSPVVHDIDATFLNEAPTAIAISDDGQWAAGLWAAGVYAFGPNGEVIPLQTDPGVVALEFFHNNHQLALATAARATSIADVGGSTQASVLYDYSAQTLAPRAIAVSADNRLAVVAASNGTLIDISVADGTATTVDCGCSPAGLFGLGGAVFRLNGIAPKRDLKVFDAAAGAVLIVPPAQSLAGGRP